MKGNYTKRKLKKIREKIEKFFYETRRFFVKLLVRKKDFSIISNNCWAGRVYQYLDMPYLSPTAGLYFFAPDYIKFVSDLKKYLDAPLEFIAPEESRYFEELKKRNQLDKPIGKILDVEIVFLHYSTKEEASEKWNRRKQRVNFDHIILKFSRMDLCTEKETEEFAALPFSNKFMLNNRKPLKHKCEVFWNEEWNPDGILRDTRPFPGNISLVRLLNKKIMSYSLTGYNEE
ncbi:MAG: DUF1919 domain-containing protein [Clostridia bacterium]|nr:DUF1919 domain-containing protein [Clostridia bacterium]